MAGWGFKLEVDASSLLKNCIETSTVRYIICTCICVMEFLTFLWGTKHFQSFEERGDVDKGILISTDPHVY